MTLAIPKDLFLDMIEHCKSELPYETCGLFSGNGENVQSRWEFNNSFKQRHRYFIAKEIVQEALTKISDKQEEVLVIYHTHPTTDPVPTYIDMKNHPDPNVIMMIVSFRLSEPRVKAYQITNGRCVDYPYLVD